MKKTGNTLLIIKLLIILLILSYSCNNFSTKENMVFQNSTINALAEGLYEGEVSFKRLKTFGDFGLGTFHNLNGEMVGLDGVFYQVRSDGEIIVVKDEQTTPFSVVTNFTAERSFEMGHLQSFDEIQAVLDDEMLSPNFIYAFKIQGVYKNLVLRSVPEQKKSTRLLDVVKHQAIFKFEEEVEGTLVGFFFPAYMKDINVPGHHFHFISNDRKKGGHVLDLEILNGKAEQKTISGFQMLLPQSEKFKNLDLGNVHEEELNAIEKIDVKK